MLTISLDGRRRSHRAYVPHRLRWHPSQQSSFLGRLHPTSLGLPRFHRRAGLLDIQAKNFQPGGKDQSAVVEEPRDQGSITHSGCSQLPTPVLELS